MGLNRNYRVEENTHIITNEVRCTFDIVASRICGRLCEIDSNGGYLSRFDGIKNISVVLQLCVVLAFLVDVFSLDYYFCFRFVSIIYISIHNALIAAVYCCFCHIFTHKPCTDRALVAASCLCSLYRLIDCIRNEIVICFDFVHKKNEICNVRAYLNVA